MKKIIWFIILLLPIFSFAGNKYYFNSSGSDGNSCSISLPCQTLTKLNSLSLSNGDSVFLNRGNSFYGNIIVNASGIYIGDYGTGARPIITGFSTLTGWSSLGGGVYQTTCAGCNINTNLLLMNGVQQSLARTPNTGYYTYQLSVGTTSVTTSSLTGTPSYVGGYVAIRNNNSQITTNKITGQSSGTLTYTAATGLSASANFGLFIINDSLCLDTLGEWYYSTGTGNMKMYFGGNTPSSYTIQTTTKDTLISIVGGLKNITLNNLDLEGAGIYGINMDNDTNVVVSNCTIKYSGGAGFAAVRSVNSSIINSYVQYCNDNGIWIGSVSVNHYVGYDTVRNIGTIPGQGRTLQGDNYKGINQTSLKGITEYNRIDTTGYDGILGYNDSSINHNSIDYYCFLMDDGAGIYHLGYTDTTKIHLIRRNVITNGIGAGVGTNNTTFTPAYGLYFDTNNFGIIADSNTIDSSVQAGIFIHNTRSATVQNNTVYNCKYQMLIQGDDAAHLIKNNVIKKNIFGIRTSAQQLIAFVSFNNIQFTNTFGSLDSNYYSFSSLITTPFLSYPSTNMAYKQWQDSTADTHGTLLTAKTSFQYNNSSTPISVSLSKNYIDILDKKYFKTITIPAYSSLLLLPGSFIVTPIGSKFSLQ